MSPELICCAVLFVKMYNLFQLVVTPGTTDSEGTIPGVYFLSFFSAFLAASLQLSVRARGGNHTTIQAVENKRKTAQKHLLQYTHPHTMQSLQSAQSLFFVIT